MKNSVIVEKRRSLEEWISLDRSHPFLLGRTPPSSIQLFPSNLIITSDEGATPYAAHIIGVKLSTGSNRLFLQFFHGVRQKNKSCISSKRWPLDLWIHPHPTLQNCRIEWPGVSYGHYSQVADYQNWWRNYNFALSGPYHKCRTLTGIQTLVLLNLLQHQSCSMSMIHLVIANKSIFPQQFYLILFGDPISPFTFSPKFLHCKSVWFATFFSQINSVNASNINNLGTFWL